MSETPSRRGFLGQIAATAALISAGRHKASAAVADGHTAEQMAARDDANLAAAVAVKTRLASRYQPLTGGIVHFFGYGQSLSGGFYGEPLLTTKPRYDNLMIGRSTRAVSEAMNCTTWVPVGATQSNGLYPFDPMIATLYGTTKTTPGETPGEGAMNFFRRAYLAQQGMNTDPACRFVLTNCSIGGKNMAEIQKGAVPETFNRLRDAANAVKASAASLGLSYQVGGMIFCHGEGDVAHGTSYASYLSGLQTLQQSFLTDIVQTIAGQPPGVVVPWFSDQPDTSGNLATTAVHQALLDWSNTPDSDFYMAGPVYQYPNHDVHLTANGYRWHGNQVGKAMNSVLLKQQSVLSLHVTSASFRAASVLANLYVPVPPLIQGDAYSLYVDTVYPNLGFIITDSGGHVPITAVTIVGQATIQIQVARALQSSPMLQAGYTLGKGEDWGTNICDSDTTLADDRYTYQAGVQDPGEDIATWNGTKLIGEPYPLNNYLAVGSVAITPD